MTSTLDDIATTMRLVANDCKDDAFRADSTPFTPRGVGELLGEHLAMIAACAKAIAIVADQLAATERVLQSRTEHLA